MKIEYTFSSTEEKQKYIETCLKIWGCVPVDAKWAINTQIYKDGK